MAHHPWDGPESAEFARGAAMRISVIIPSALKHRPGMPGLWLSQAIGSVARQTLPAAEILVGTDPGVTPPSWSSNDFAEGCWPAGGFRFVEGDRPGHQAACNACARAAAGPLLAFLEDDDAHAPNHLELLLREMRDSGADFVSCSQRQVAPDGQPLGVFHFPTCSGWLMPRLLWMAVGGFDVRFKIHHDNRALGVLNDRATRRLHLVPEGTDLDHPWLKLLTKNSAVKAVPGLADCTVLRTVHEGSVLGGCRANPERANLSAKEYAALEVLHGEIPW